MKIKGFALTAIALSVVVGLSACGGGDSSSTTSATSTTTTTGPITAFGSIFVNSTEFDTSSANITIDGVAATEVDLKVGMIVSVQNDGTNKAMDVSFNDEVEGIVTSIIDVTNGQVEVMGQTITIDDNTIFDSNVVDILDLSMVKEGNVIEVSGYSDGMGTITATRIEVKATAYTIGEELEVKGIVANYTPDIGSGTFQIGGLTVFYADENILPTGFGDGMYVEVESMEALNDLGQLVASKVSPMSTDMENDDYELKGMIMEISGVDLLDGTIKINNKTFIIDANTQFTGADTSKFIVGALVEVEAYKNVDGDLVAKTVEFEDKMGMVNAPLKGKVVTVDITDVNIGTITLDDINQSVVLVNNDTIMKDNSAADIQAFNLQDIAVDNYLMIKVTETISAIDNSTILTATKLTRKNVPAAMPETPTPGAGTGPV
ncbi:hypothetical protein MNBD_GAMMA22-872, partial [hydrothermal vent metagenome]